jgi:hypothetical protein
LERSILDGDPPPHSFWLLLAEPWSFSLIMWRKDGLVAPSLFLTFIFEIGFQNGFLDGLVNGVCETWILSKKNSTKPQSPSFTRWSQVVQQARKMFNIGFNSYEVEVSSNPLLFLSCFLEEIQLTLEIQRVYPI